MNATTEKESGFASLPPARRLVVLIGLGVIAIGVTVLGLRLLIQDGPAGGVIPGFPNWSPASASKARPASLPSIAEADLKPIRGETPYLRQRTKTRFLEMLGSAQIYEHPYAIFLKENAARLPDRARSCSSAAEVTAALRELAARLNPELDVRELPADRLVGAVEHELNYDDWRQKAGRRVYADRDKPLDEPLRRFVEEFRTPDAGLRAAAERMKDALQKWGERDLPASPFALIDRFFQALTRPAGMPRGLDHVGVDFLRRLPTEPVAAGQTFDSEDELSAMLRRLLYLLDREFNPFAGRMPAAELADRIAGEMRFQEFVKRNKERHYRDAEAAPEVQALWKKFE